jgi:hypothetical protein
MLTPSNSCQPSNYWKIQNDEPLIVDDRYATRPCLVALPIEVYHPSFAVFCALANNYHLDPDESMILHTAELMRAASKIATRESVRQTPTRELLSKLLSYTLIQTVNKNKTSSDHAIVMSCKRPAPPLGAALIAVVEEKAELGTGGEPSVEGSFSYIQHWADPNQQVGAI